MWEFISCPLSQWGFPLRNDAIFFSEFTGMGTAWNNDKRFDQDQNRAAKLSMWPERQMPSPNQTIDCFEVIDCSISSERTAPENHAPLMNSMRKWWRVSSPSRVSILYWLFGSRHVETLWPWFFLHLPNCANYLVYSTRASPSNDLRRGTCTASLA